jgi:hypothetical protein
MRPQAGKTRSPGQLRPRATDRPKKLPAAGAILADAHLRNWLLMSALAACALPREWQSEEREREREREIGVAISTCAGFWLPQQSDEKVSMLGNLQVHIVTKAKYERRIYICRVIVKHLVSPFYGLVECQIEQATGNRRSFRLFVRTGRQTSGSGRSRLSMHWSDC